ncbi:hypothetical protein IEQ34_011594 [Dendrobium chrysotoxum]|uniref:Uncharacterized protein n=1 Tax=Dendrobium chrysotoxum TaxID=161865 RepID=A0AAV7GU38_DENCH|nr:hypothetical protein IEQ34_011594 [Dendrobium chrysotoxum]
MLGHSKQECYQLNPNLRKAQRVESIAMEGEDKDHFILIGDGIDLIKLIESLQRKFDDIQK